ncbi:unnamed protein product [Symbiodinium necroappetens]|uniref:Uncharacterized protein n=1 Tax=Symbiodinium necroappetens TaxID=1628268 RepID=A0A812YHL3_9DINO|nr:unnamed protein product [Symbiodinium necroappetens]
MSREFLALNPNPEPFTSQDWHFGYRLRLRCAFSVEEYEKGKVGSGPTLGLEENLKLLADWIWLIHHFTAEEEDSAATVELYTSKQFLAKDINGEKVPLTETKKVIEELWTRNAEEINMDHITKKLKTQALELYSRIEM